MRSERIILTQAQTDQRAAALRARWGEKRTESAQIRVDADVAQALSALPDRERREFASKSLRDALAIRNKM